MAVPAYRAGSYLTANVAAATSVVPTLPTGWAVGDLSTIFIWQNNVTSTKPAATGWTPFTHDDRAANAQSFQGYWRVMQAGDTAPTFSWTTLAQSRWQSAAFTGENTTTPENVSNGSNNASSTTITCPGVTPTDPSTLLIWSCNILASSRTITIPAGMSSIGSSGGAATFEAAMAYEVYSGGTSATGNRNGSISGAATNSVAELIAIKGVTPFSVRNPLSNQVPLQRASIW